jgi:1-phosphatidylinositol-3-phosphate 5-kinase
MVRVCNLCLGKLAKDDDDDDDDHRSVVSSVTSFPAHQMGGDSIPMSLGHHVQSPFAASQLFGRTDEPFNLYSIAETKRPVYGSEDSGLASRPVTPRMTEGEDGVWEPVLNEPVPFRRGLVDEEKEPVNIPGTFSNEGSPTAKTPIDFPVTVSVNVESPMSSIQFPVGSPDWTDSPRPQSRLRSRFNSYGDFEATTPFIRSRVQSRLDNVPTGEPGWRTRRESTA